MSPLSIDYGRVVSELIGLTAVAGVPVLLPIGSLVSGRKRGKQSDPSTL